MQDSVSVSFADGSIDVECLTLLGFEAVGVTSRFQLEVSSDEPILPAQVLGKWAFIEAESRVARRGIAGVVTQFTRIAATISITNRRRYRVVVEPSTSRMRRTQRSRVFQKMTIPDIVHKVLVDGGLAPDHIQARVSQTHPEQEYVVQYDETDETFLRRMCERAGLYFHFVDLGEESETLEEGIVVADDSTSLDPDLDLDVVCSSSLEGSTAFARGVVLRGKLRTGKVTLRDYDHEKPSLLLEAEAEHGHDIEKAQELYLAPAGFANDAEGKALAQRWLEARRVDTRTVSFESNQVLLAPGRCCTLVPGAEQRVSAEGPHVVTATTHRWKFEEGYRLQVVTVPRSAPVRLQRVTPEPQISGIHSAWVTGPDGEEIFPDGLGRVRVRFGWDLDGPTDESSSLPVRVAQPNTPKSMAFPRIGWEVFVAFEDGNPERPFVLGRCYNAKQPPPYGLPANKNSTAIRSFSSPGGGAMNSIEFNDTSGKQGLTINAGFGMSTTVGGDLSIQTDKVEEHNVGASQTVTVGGTEDVSVKQTYKVSTGDQTATVGGSQDISVAGKFDVKVGSEAVSIGGALMEQIGSPGAIAASLASAAALSGSKSKLAKKWLGNKGTQAVQAYQKGKGIYTAYQQGGMSAAASAGLDAGLGQLAGKVPGGDALFLGVKEKALGGKYPWDKPAGRSGPDGGAGGAGAAQADGAGAAAGGSGDKQHSVKGNATEMVGGAHAIVSPASIDWETAGGQASLLVGGVHNTKCANATLEALGAASTTSSSHFVNVDGELSRTVNGACTTTTGPLKIESNGHLTFEASTIDIKVGSLKLTGSAVTFKCGGSTVSFSGSGIMIKSGSIKFTKATKQSGDVKH